MRISALLASGLAGVALTLGLAVPASAAEARDCTKLPYSSIGCDETTGAAARRDLLEKNILLPWVSNATLGRVVREMCTHSTAIGGPGLGVPGSMEEKVNFANIRLASVPRRCG